MKIALSSAGSTLESKLDQRFGRAEYFIIADTDTGEFKAVANVGAVSSGGAGIAAAQLAADNGVKAVITGNTGPNAMNVLSAAEIEIYRGTDASIKENIEFFKKVCSAK